MPLEALISKFGYPALAIGLLLEGETVLVLGAFMAHRGYLNLSLVIAIAFLVTFASDQFFFWMGRTKGSQFLEKRPAWKQSVERARALMHGNTTFLFIGFRFMYGLRTIMPFVFGLSRFDPKRFAILNSMGVLLWALTFGLAGYLFGHLMELIVTNVSKYEIWIVLFFLLPGVLVWLHQQYRNRKRENSEQE
jgi:membrane protein DedA with SNARE-associated domain